MAVEFKKLSPAQKRVQIAKDVIAQLKAEVYQVVQLNNR